MTHFPSFPIFIFYFLITSAPNGLAQGQGGGLPANPSGTTMAPTITQPGPPVTTGGGSGQWCVAGQNVSPKALQVALDYACGYGGADCGQIQSGASCYEPNTIHDHASYAFNDYYQKHPGSQSCLFGGAAQLTSTDPSKGNCRFPASSRSTSVNPPNPPSPPSPPVYTPPANTIPTTTPNPTPTTGFSGTIPEYGIVAPTGLPSSSYRVISSFLPILAAAGMMLVPLLQRI